MVTIVSFLVADIPMGGFLFRPGVVPRILVGTIHRMVTKIQVLLGMVNITKVAYVTSRSINMATPPRASIPAMVAAMAKARAQAVATPIAQVPASALAPETNTATVQALALARTQAIATIIDQVKAAAHITMAKVKATMA